MRQLLTILFTLLLTSCSVQYQVSTLGSDGIYESDDMYPIYLEVPESTKVDTINNLYNESRKDFDQFVGRSAFDPIADFGGGVIRDFTGIAPVIEGLSMDTQQTQQLFAQTDDDNVNVFLVNGEQRASITSTGR